MTKCEHDPKLTVGPIGMYHCPECGDMVIAGMDHPDMDDVDKQYEIYLDEKYKQFVQYLKSRLGESTYETMVLYIERMPYLKETLMEVWLRADMNADFKCCRCDKPTFAYNLYCSPFCDKAQELELTEIKDE